ncbi:MAG: lepB [Herbinix sp.]|jgi:signal peptidase I|nr:lepB [Herbinix sp.]
MDGKNILKELRSWIFIILIVLVAALLINSKLFAKYIVEQSSMEDTLFHDQHVFVDKLSYYIGEPKRGDIIIFLEGEEKGTILNDTIRTFDGIVAAFDKEKKEDKHKRLVKRVIGVAGDEVDIIDGYVYVNGEKLEEPYVKGETLLDDFKLPVTVEEDKLFVLGDHRTVSVDSRDFGLIDLNQVEGKAVFRVYPFNQVGRIR